MPSSAAVDAQEEQARAYLAAGKFRKARDEIKLLCKKDRAKYLPWLIEANAGLAREMISRGQTSEAEQVIGYLKTIAPPELVSGLAMEAASRSKSPIEQVSGMLALLANGAGSSQSRDRRRELADQIVLTFTVLEPRTPAEAQVAAEVRAIHQALEAVSGGKHAEAMEWIRQVGQDSDLREWRIFIKGLVAFHLGESEKAVRCFEQLPADSVLGRAREPYLLLLGRMEIGTRTWAEETIEAAGRLGGGLANWGKLLEKAQRLWLDQKHEESYLVLWRALPPFPSEGLDIIGELSDFYFSAISGLTPDAHDEYFDFFLAREMEDECKSPTELKMIRRICCLDSGKKAFEDALTETWEAVLHEHERVHGPNPALSSLAYRWLGRVLGGFKKAAGNFGERLQPWDADGAVEALRKSIELDPNNLSAYLDLTELYEALGMKSDRNRLLDLMTQRFPESKAVLVQAARGCMDRKAYSKGLGYLTKARQLDLLDPAIPDLTVSANLALAKEGFRKGRLDQSRLALKACEPFCTDPGENFLRNRWCHLVRSGVLEELYGDPGQAAELLRQARAMSPSAGIFLWFARLASVVYGGVSGDLGRFKKDFQVAELGKPSLSVGWILVRIYFFWKANQDDTDLTAEHKWLKQYLRDALRQPCTRDEVAELSGFLVQRSELKEQALAFISAALKRDKKDPLLRMYQRLLRPHPFSNKEAEMWRIEEILQEATRRGDEKAAKLARQSLDTLRAPPPRPVPVEDELDDAELAEAMDSVFEAEGFPLGGIAPKEEALFADLLELISKASDAELRRMRKELPKDMPKEMFDMLVAASKMGGPGQRGFPKKPAPPPKPFQRPKPSDPGEAGPQKDPNQMDLF